MTVMASLKKFWKTAVILFVIGLVLSFILKNNFAVSGLVFVADLLFTVSVVFLAWGLIHLIGNMDLFAGMIYGTKCLMKLIRGKQDPSQAMRDGYLEYLKTRRRHADVPMLLLFAAGFFVLSVLVSLLAA